MRERGLTEGGEGELPPQINLRVPGPWRSPEELDERLALAGGGYRAGEEHIVHDATGNRYDWRVSPHDDEIHEIFAHSGGCRTRRSARSSRTS